MRNLSYLFIIALLLSSFGLEGPEGARDMAFSELSCYRIKPRAVSHSDYNIWVVTNTAALEETFVADACSTSPDFDKQLVVALKVETDQWAYQVDVKRVTVKDQAINVYFHVRKLGVLSEAGSPLEMTEISRDKTVRKINFYHDNMLVKSVPIVAVY